jgi:hypothetical protein
LKKNRRNRQCSIKNEHKYFHAFCNQILFHYTIIRLAQGFSQTFLKKL